MGQFKTVVCSSPHTLELLYGSKVTKGESIQSQTTSGLLQQTIEKSTRHTYKTWHTYNNISKHCSAKLTIYSGASILGGETVIGNNSIIGGNTFITSSVPEETRVSIKNPEMEYRTRDNVVKTEEIKQSDEWFYII